MSILIVYGIALSFKLNEQRVVNLLLLYPPKKMLESSSRAQSGCQCCFALQSLITKR